MPGAETNSRRRPPFEIRVEKWVYGGKGLGRLGGKVVMTPFVLPGEVARVEAVREHPGFVEAALVGVLSSSPHRVEPFCPYFARCGGCHYQHAAYEFQLAQKAEILRETLRRAGNIAAEDFGVVSGQSPRYYRNRVQLHISGGEIGFRQAASRRICPVSLCPVASPALNDALAALRRMAPDRRFPKFVRSIELFTNESQVQLNVIDSAQPVARRFFEWCAEAIPGARAGSLDYPAAGRLFRVSRRSFFQVNRFLIDALVDTAVGEAEGETALDLYAGAGLFSMALCARFRSVTAVESSAAAARDLAHNAQRAACGVRVEQSSAERFLEGLARPPDFVLADPPRAGLGRAVVRSLLRLAPPRLALVSCDPATLARDLEWLTSGGYRIDRVRMVDLFPQTFHIETVAFLSLGGLTR